MQTFVSDRPPHRGGSPVLIRDALRWAFVCAVLVSSAGCYTFRPAAAEDIGVGEDVRLRLTGAFSDSLAPLLGWTDARVVEGLVVVDEPSALMLEVPVNRQMAGTRIQSVAQRVEIPDDAFVDVEIRELSKPRTVAAIASVAGAAAAIAIWQFAGDNGGGTLPGTGQPVESPVARPWFSVTLGALASLFGR